MIGHLWTNFLIINRSLHSSIKLLTDPVTDETPSVISDLRGNGKLITLDNLISMPQKFELFSVQISILSFFPNRALKDFKKEFLTPHIGSPARADCIRGLYTSEEITPYIHALIAHVPSMLTECVKEGLSLGWFSASAQEKLNHLQVAYFFGKTFKGGVQPNEAEKSMMMSEGRRILFVSENTKQLRENNFCIKDLLKTTKPRKILVRYVKTI